MFVSPWYFALLIFFGYRDPAQGLLWAACITLSLLVHEFGHALVARHLRHDPSISLHGFGGTTSRTRTGRDVEEAAIVAMGPAAGLVLGMIVYGGWQVLAHFDLNTAFAARVAYALLVPCILWNLLNLLPLWPLDGGQLFRLGLGRLLGPSRAGKVTHALSIAVVVLLAVFALRNGMYFWLVLLVMLGMQNVQAMQGQSVEVDTPRASPLAFELVESASEALRTGQFKEAARLAHQARAQEGASPTLMERIWEILGVATRQLGEYEEALAYLRRARPTEAVRTATYDCLTQLERQEELAEIQTRWASLKSSGSMARWLTGALSVIAFALALVFSTSLSDLLRF